MQKTTSTDLPTLPFLPPWCLPGASQAVQLILSCLAFELLHILGLLPQPLLHDELRVVVRGL